MVKEVHIVANPEEDQFKKDVKEKLHKFQHLSEVDDHELDAPALLKLVEDLAQSCIAKSQLDRFQRKLAQHKASTPQQVAAARGRATGSKAQATRVPLRILDSVSTEILPLFLDWKSPVAEMHMNRAYQDIMREEHAHLNILKFLKSQLEVRAESVVFERMHSVALHSLYKMCFHFLSLWCQHNAKNKMELAKKEFAFLMHCTKYGIGAAECLVHVLKDNSSCHSINHINEKMVQRVTDEFVSRVHCRTAAHVHLLYSLIMRNGRAGASKVQALLFRLQDDERHQVSLTPRGRGFIHIYIYLN